MRETYTNFISAVFEKNYSVAHKYLQEIVEAKLKAKIKKAVKSAANDKKNSKMKGKKSKAK